MMPPAADDADGNAADDGPDTQEAPRVLTVLDLLKAVDRQGLVPGMVLPNGYNTPYWHRLVLGIQQQYPDLGVEEIIQHCEAMGA